MEKKGGKYSEVSLLKFEIFDLKKVNRILSNVVIDKDKIIRELKEKKK